MSPKIPTYTPKKVLQKLQRAGFTIHRIKESHIILKSSDENRRVTIAMHRKDLKLKTFLSILMQAGLSFEEFLKL